MKKNKKYFYKNKGKAGETENGKKTMVQRVFDFGLFFCCCN